MSPKKTVKPVVNRVICGNALETLKNLKDDSFDACITDPPYNISGSGARKEIGWYKSNATWRDEKAFEKIDEDWDKFSESDYAEFTSAWLTEVCRVVKPNGNLLIFGSYHNIYRIGAVLEDFDRRIINSIIWYKRNAFPNITNRMFCESTEQIIWAANETRKRARNWTFNYSEMKELTENGKQMRNMWDIPMTPRSEKEEGKHPSQKPLEVMNRLILGCTNAGDRILDPFAGSGSTLVSAKTHGRSFLGIEKDEDFVELSRRRLKNAKRLVQ